MHELPTVKDIHGIILQRAGSAGATRVVSVDLDIGGLSDLQDEWIRRYFAHLSSGTIVEGATVNIERSPGLFRCGGCRESFEVESITGVDLRCPECRSADLAVVSGRGFRVKGIEII